MKCEWSTIRGEVAPAAKIALTCAVMVCFAACGHSAVPQEPVIGTTVLRVGAERTSDYLPLLSGQRVAVVCNQTARIGTTHLVDSLLSLGVQLVKVFGPEHGFRGEAPDGAKVKDEIDARTGLPLVSLYGANKKLDPDQLADVDVIVFDIQDVGVRFYTFISTLHYVMEGAAAAGKKVIVLDRPNPNGSYVDGPLLDVAYRSFVGMHPIPLVHGMTVGELAGMINGEKWLEGSRVCDLTVISCEGYTHATAYSLPMRPSPNLPNDEAIALYPSLGLFEGTIVSVGRGTDLPFECIGYPGCPVGNFTFTPRSLPSSTNPPHLNRTCRGYDLRVGSEQVPVLAHHLEIKWLLEMYSNAPKKDQFFTPYFDKLAGGKALREMIIAGNDEAFIRATWQKDLDAFIEQRTPYLLYPIN